MATIRFLFAVSLTFFLSGCTATPKADEDQFVVKNIGGAKCIIYRPGSTGFEGTQMECDFA